MRCSHVGYMLQLILKHIIRSSAIHPAAIWITSKNSTYHLPSSTLPPKKIRKTDSRQSSWVFYIHHTVEQCGFCVYKALLLTSREHTGSLSLNLPSPDIFQVLPCWTWCAARIHLLSQRQSGLTEDTVGNRTELLEPVATYPDSGCHSSLGSQFPVFSLEASLPLMKEKIRMLHAGSLGYDKKQVLLNKPDVNNCWKQYRAVV